MKDKTKSLQLKIKSQNIAIDNLICFVQFLRGNELTQSSFHYLSNNPLDKNGKNGKFGKAQRAEFYKWLVEDDKTVKEIWENLAIKSFTDKGNGKEFVDMIFKYNSIDDLIKNVEKTYTKVGKKS
jgi:hypothetical protein